MYYRSSTPYDGWVLLAVVIVGVGLTLWRKFSVGQRLGGATASLADAEDGSAILEYYSAGHNLTNASRGKIQDMSYSIFITSRQGQYSGGLGYVEQDAMIYVLDLPFNTQSHLVGLSKDFGMNRVQFESLLKANGMEKIMLEGNFPDYFDLYAKKGQQLQARYVMDPDAMQAVVEYCRSNFWEINNAELYFVTSTSGKSSSNVVEESQKFLAQIKPALLPSDPSAPVVHHDVPYGEYDGPAMSCPICSKTMSVHDAWQACPDGHGFIINGRDLMRVRNQTLQIPVAADRAVTHGQLICPNCRNKMVAVDYEETGVQIDSCEHCPFRWIDADDVAHLLAKAQPQPV